MSDSQKYSVSTYEPADAPGTLVFTLVPNGDRQGPGPVRASHRVPEFVAKVGSGTNGLHIDWSGSPDDQGPKTLEMEAEITTRTEQRTAWIRRVNELVDAVELAARDWGWATRRIEKQLDDARVGKHKVPALLMQAETSRILLEPVGRSAPGVEGVVDLYLMPAYDDIAHIYHYDGRWNLHYAFPGTQPVATLREAEALPLTKETIGRVREEMKCNAV